MNFFAKVMEINKKVIKLISEELNKTHSNPFSDLKDKDISLEKISDLLDMVENKSDELEAQVGTTHVWVERIDPEEYENCIRQKQRNKYERKSLY